MKRFFPTSSLAWPRKSNVKILLHALGMVLMALAFFTRQASTMVWVQRVFAPNYVRAATAFGRLLEQDILTPDQEGFDDLVGVLKSVLLQNNNSAAVVNAVRVTRFIASPKGVATLVTWRDAPAQVRVVTVEFSDGQSWPWHHLSVQAHLEQLLIRRTLTVSIIVFAVGFVFELVAFQIKLRFLERGNEPRQ